MGNSESSDNHKFDGCETLGYRILGVQPDSPASRAGLVSFFDFLVGVNGQLLFGIDDGSGSEYFEDVDFPALLKNSVDKEIELLVWNIKNKTQRFLTLTPTTSWGGKGLLGVTIRMDDYVTAEENLLRVLSVQKQSPAALAGLTSKTDYLLGTTIESFESEDVLADVLEENEDCVLEMYVYNTESDVVRVLTFIPSSTWGGKEGQGLLGAEIGRGYLHRLPKNCRDTLGVSFERKVRVNEQNETSCGAIDLKLNETAKVAPEPAAVDVEAINTEKTSSQVDDMTLSEEQNIEQHKNEELSRGECANTTKTSFTNNDPSIPMTHTVESMKSNGTQESKIIESTSPPMALDHQNLQTNSIEEDKVPESQVSKFPSTPQLQDFALIGMTRESSDEHAASSLGGALPPPPISSLATEVGNEEELTAVDLR